MRGSNINKDDAQTMADGTFASKDPRGKMEQKDPNRCSAAAELGFRRYANFESLTEIYWTVAPALPISQPRHGDLRSLDREIALIRFSTTAVGLSCDTGASTMQHPLTRALLRPRRRRGVEFRSKQSPREMLMSLPLRPPTDNVLVSMVGLTAIQDLR